MRGFYRRRLPHLQRDFKPHFVTFCTFERLILPASARDVTLECCLRGNGVTMNLHVCVVMPDHVHLIFTPLINAQRNEITSLARIMNAIKGASSHEINRALRRTGQVWQAESFDHVLRSSENLDAKIAYVFANPVRAGLVANSDDYRWLWRKQSHHQYRPPCERTGSM